MQIEVVIAVRRLGESAEGLMSPHEHESRQEQEKCGQSWCSCFRIQWKKPC